MLVRSPGLGDFFTSRCNHNIRELAFAQPCIKKSESWVFICLCLLGWAGKEACCLWALGTLLSLTLHSPRVLLDWLSWGPDAVSAKNVPPSLPFLGVHLHIIMQGEFCFIMVEMGGVWANEESRKAGMSNTVFYTCLSLLLDLNIYG